jgi:hypothetical protein
MNEELKASPQLDCQLSPLVEGVKWSEEGLIQIPSTLVPNSSSSFAWTENNKSTRQ